MLDIEVTTQADALEIHLCKELDKCTPIEMEQEDAIIMINLLSAPDNDFGSQDELKAIWVYQALLKRAELCITCKVDNRVLFFIMMISDGAIGTSIMYLYYIQYLAKKKNINHVTFDLFCKKIFPHGFFSEEDLSRIWYNCKVKTKNGTANLIDFGTASESIQFSQTKETV